MVRNKITKGYVNKSPEDSQASIDNPKPSPDAFVTNHIRHIANMPVPVDLQNDPEYAQLVREGRHKEAANRAENLGFYALAHAMRRNINDSPVGDIGLMGNSKSFSSLGSLLRDWPDSVRKGDYRKLYVLCDALEENGYREVNPIRQTIEMVETNKKRDAAYHYDNSTLFMLLTKAQSWYVNGAKSMGSFLSKNFKLPKVKCGFLKKRSMGLEPSGSCGCSACNHGH